jgi:hypothetical protein
MVATITWTNGLGTHFTTVNGHKLSQLSVGYLVEKLGSHGLPAHHVGGLYDSLPAALAATRGVTLIPARSLRVGAQVVEPRYVSGTSTPADHAFTVTELQQGRFTHYRLLETGEVRTLAPSAEVEVRAATWFDVGDPVRIVLDGAPTPPLRNGLGVVTKTYRDNPWVDVNVRGIVGKFEIDKVRHAR